jgi:hypothetical protein
MVARRPKRPCWNTMVKGALGTWRATIKALPIHPHPARPYGPPGLIARKGRYASERELGNDMRQQSCKEKSLWVEDFHPLALLSASISLHCIEGVLGLFQTNAIETAVELDGFQFVA